jgi:flagellar motor switch protein FliM
MDAELDQEQIDALLDKADEDSAAGGAALESALAELVGDRPARGAARPFDFSRPYSISRNFDKNLRSLADNYAKAASLLFTNLLRSNCELEFRRVLLHTFGEYQANLPNPACLATVTLAPLKGSALLHTDLSLTFAMLKRLLGGPIEAEARLREFTEIELSVVRSLALKHLDLFKTAGARIVAMDPKIVALENNPTYLNVLSPGDSVVTLEFRFHLENLDGDLTYCLPLAAFEPVRALFDPEESSEPRPTHEVRRDRELVFDLVQGVAVEAVVKLGDLGLTVERLMRLEEGDVLPLPLSVDAPLALEVEDRPLFLGTAGRVRQQRALKLTRSLSEE